MKNILINSSVNYDINDIVSHLDASKPIVIEGCDLSGKDTFLNKLKSTIGDDFPVIRGTQDDSNKFNHWLSRYCNYKSNVIFMRNHLSTMIYGYVMNDPRINDREFVTLGLLNDCLSYNTIYLDVDEQELIRRYNERGDDYCSLEQVIEANKLYKQHYQNLGLYPPKEVDVDGR